MRKSTISIKTQYIYCMHRNTGKISRCNVSFSYNLKNKDTEQKVCQNELLYYGKMLRYCFLLVFPVLHVYFFGLLNH